MANSKLGLLDRFKSASISNKILLIVIACSLLSLGLLTSSSVYRGYQHDHKQLAETLESISGIVVGNTVAALRFEDVESATETLSSLAAEKKILSATIIDENGRVFAQYVSSARSGTLVIDVPMGASLIGDTCTYAQTITLSDKNIGKLVLIADCHQLFSQLRQNLLINSLILIISLIVSIFLAKRLLPIITDPIEELAMLAKRVSEQRDYTLRAQKRNEDEIGILVDSINFMLSSVRQRDQEISENNRNLEKLVADRTEKLVTARERAESALDAKSDFLSTISHELRTPMNAIIGMSSVLQQSDLDPNRARQIEIIQKSAINLLDLINDILDYSKIEANKLELDNSIFDLVNCVEESLDIAAATKKNNRLIYCSSFDPSLPSHIKGDVTRLRQIIVNLLSNAFKFTRRGSVIVESKLIPADRRSNERLRISVKDTGIGIPQESLDTIFESFTQANKTTSRDYGGTGLGLTISYRLALAMGGTLTVDSELGEGAAFHLTIPITRAKSFQSVVGKPLDTNQPLSVLLKGLPQTIEATIRSNLTAWGCEVQKTDSETSERPSLILASAISDDEFRSVEKATRLSKFDNVAYLAHADHSILIQKTTGKTVLNLPIRIRDLRNLLLKHVETDETPHYDPTTPFAAYPTEKWRNLRILLAEDNELSRNVFLHHMELIGLEIDTASNGVSACELALKHHYDIIFMDVRMPLRDGLKSTEYIRGKLRKDRPQPWVIGFTANTDPDALLEIESAGMNDYLAKPAVISDIAECINRYHYNRSNDPSVVQDA